MNEPKPTNLLLDRFLAPLRIALIICIIYQPAPPHTTGYHVSLLPSIQSHHTLTAERSDGRSSSGNIMDEDESVEGRKLWGKILHIGHKSSHQ